MDKLHVTREGLDKMKAELTDCNKRRLHLAKTIEKAREFGDLSENAEYHAAKEAQAILHARIRDLEDKIARTVILDHQAIDDSKAYVGATVRVRNTKTHTESTYILVSPVEADTANGKISIKSPVGQALLGKSVGDTAATTIPAGQVELEILEITR